jgi:uncharacterized protein (DUF427 family)
MRTAELPGPDHPITIAANPARIVVRAGGQVVAEMTSALTLREAAYPPVQYIPVADVTAGLSPTVTATYCPYKGDASYYDLTIGRPDGTVDIVDAVWTYEDPYAAVASIGSHVAFYPDRVEILVEDGVAP